MKFFWKRLLKENFIQNYISERAWETFLETDDLNSSFDLQFPQSLFQAFGDHSEGASYNWYHCHFHVPQFFHLSGQIQVQWNLGCQTQSVPKLCSTTYLFENWFNVVRPSSCFPRQSFTRISFLSARLVGSNSEHLFDHWDIFYSVFFCRTLNCSTWESFDNRGSTVFVYLYVLFWYRLIGKWVECSPNGLGDLGSIPGRVIPSNIRYVSRVKWSNPGKGVAPSLTPRCSSYWKGSLRVALDYGRQLTFYFHPVVR